MDRFWFWMRMLAPFGPLMPCMAMMPDRPVSTPWMCGRPHLSKAKRTAQKAQKRLPVATSKPLHSPEPLQWFRKGNGGHFGRKRTTAPVGTDLTQSSSFEFMRPKAGPRLDVDPSSAVVVQLALSHDEIAVAIDNVLHTFDWTGTPQTQKNHESTILSLAHHENAWWTTTEFATHRDGQSIGPGGITLVQSPDAVWVLTPTALIPLMAVTPRLTSTTPSDRRFFG